MKRFANIGNFEAFRWNISLSANLLFLKSAGMIWEKIVKAFFRFSKIDEVDDHMAAIVYELVILLFRERNESISGLL